MQIDLTPSEAAVTSGLIMAQLHPLLVLMRDTETTEIIISVLNKIETAAMAEAN
jgi:hypothetical protein